MNALLFPCGVEGSLCTRFGLGAGKRTVVGFALLGLVKSIGFDLLGLVGFAALGLVWFCCLRAKNAWMPVVMPSLPYNGCFVLVAHALTILKDGSLVPSGAIQST